MKPPAPAAAAATTAAPRSMVSSSPGRAEKQLPAPGLARLLLSKSRRRPAANRSSPMFVSRSRSVGRAAAAAAAAAAENAGSEPSSPKVTCIGQVRMRKNKNKNKSKNGSKQKQKRKKMAVGCRCLKKALFCGVLFKRKTKTSSSSSLWPPWGFGGGGGGGGRGEEENASTSYSNGKQSYKKSREMEVDGRLERVVVRSPDPRSEDGEEEEEEEKEETCGFGLRRREEEEEEEKVFVSSATTTPPKNALLLMRCRSAPQNRNSPLTSRFPTASPAPALEFPETDVADVKEEVEKEAEEEREVEQEVEEEEEQEQEQDEEEMRCSSARPLVLPRCKSEPATTATAKMALPEAAGCFWANGSGGGRRRQVGPSREAVTSH